MVNISQMQILKQETSDEKARHNFTGALLPF
jgi:hypothetical protein